MPGQADPFKIRVECPLDDIIIRQSVQHILRDLLTAGKVYHPYRGAICTIAKEQDFKIRGL